MPTRNGLEITVRFNVRSAEDIAAVADPLATLLKFQQVHEDVVVTMVPSAPMETVDIDHVDPPDPPGTPPPDTPPPDTSPPDTSPPKRVRDRTAERARAKAAAKGDNVAKPTPGNGLDAPVPDPDPVARAPAENGLLDDMFEAAAPGAVSGPEPVPEDPVLARSRTPQQAKDSSLVVLRCIFMTENNTAKARVKELQKAMQKEHDIVKFTEMPLAAAPDMFTAAYRLARELNIPLPGGL